MATALPQGEAAMRSTYGKMGRWLRARALKGMSSRMQIKQKILRGRIKAFRLQGGVSGSGGAKVWFGLKSIPVIRLNARESGKGVKADGGRYIEGAFIAKIGGRPQVLKRTGHERLPVEVQTVHISDEAQTYIEDELIGTTEFENQFFKFLTHELKWRTQIFK